MRASEIKSLLNAYCRYFSDFFLGLEQISQGEEILNLISEKDFITRISNGNSNILLGVSSINAAATQHKNQEFQIQ